MKLDSISMTDIFVSVNNAIKFMSLSHSSSLPLSLALCTALNVMLIKLPLPFNCVIYLYK